MVRGATKEAFCARLECVGARSIMRSERYRCEMLQMFLPGAVVAFDFDFRGACHWPYVILSSRLRPGNVHLRRFLISPLC